MRVIWKPGDLVNLQLRNNMFTIGQMLGSPYMRFYKVHNDNGKWGDLDLRNEEELFTVPVARGFLQKRGVGKIKKGVVASDDCTISEYWIRASLNRRGGDLVQIDPDKGSRGFEDTVIIDGIKSDDRETLMNYEFTNVRLDQELTERLILCLEAGRNLDPFKQKVFPDADFLR